MVTSGYLGNAEHPRKMEALEARQEQLVFRFPEKNLPSLEVVTMITTAGFIRLVFPSVPALLRHMAEIARMHSYPFESILPLYQSLNATGE